LIALVMVVSDDVLIIHASKGMATKFLSLMRRRWCIPAYLTTVENQLTSVA